MQKVHKKYITNNKSTLFEFTEIVAENNENEYNILLNDDDLYGGEGRPTGRFSKYNQRISKYQYQDMEDRYEQ
jgi:hypothetical protein